LRSSSVAFAFAFAANRNSPCTAAVVALVDIAALVIVAFAFITDTLVAAFDSG
jgi:hypothetical protein